MENVSDNLLASFVEGTSTCEEAERVIKAIHTRDDIDFFLITNDLHSVIEEDLN